MACLNCHVPIFPRRCSGIVNKHSDPEYMSRTIRMFKKD